MIKYLFGKYSHDCDLIYKALVQVSGENKIEIVEYLYGKNIIFIKHLFNFNIVTKYPRKLFYDIIRSQCGKVIKIFLENDIFCVDEFYEDIVKSIPKYK